LTFREGIEENLAITVVAKQESAKIGQVISNPKKPLKQLKTG
jgi:hypothetical protein